MFHPARPLLFMLRPRASSLGSPRRVVWRIVFSLGLIAVCIPALPRTSQAQSLNLLYSFGQTATDGKHPYAGLMQASDGNLYGTTLNGGANGWGMIFRITTGGAFTTLYNFTGKTDGISPEAGLIQASDGNLYGTAAVGGANDNGTVFRITTGGTLTTLHSFTALSNGTNMDGAYPDASLMQASDGNLYGTAVQGGANGDGTVFRITTGGAFTTLHSFNGTDGNGPIAGLTQASDGNFYATTRAGGASDAGTVFRITTGGTLTTLYSFTGGADGDGTYAGLIQAKDGNLYGTTVGGGGANSSGTVFRITTGGTLTTLYRFGGYPTDGAYPVAGLIQASDGNLYGTASGGGTNNNGTVFRITAGGTLTTLYTFSAFSGSLGTNSDGGGPEAGVIQAHDGSLYGTCFWGGHYGLGTVFAVSLGPPPPALTRLKPSTANAAGPDFTLTLKGSLFTRNSTVQWTNGGATALTTTYVTSTQLKAVVPASLLANAGTATVTVANAGGGVSNGISFTILLTTLKLSSAKLTKTRAGNYTAKISLQNTGYLTAPGVTITQATLGTAVASTTLPLSLGSIANGKTGSTSLSFPSSAGSSGAVVTLNVTGTFTGGSFTASPKVKLP